MADVAANDLAGAGVRRKESIAFNQELFERSCFGVMDVAVRLP
jgi:hypothetical protein